MISLNCKVVRVLPPTSPPPNHNFVVKLNEKLMMESQSTDHLIEVNVQGAEAVSNYIVVEDESAGTAKEHHATNEEKTEK